MIEIVKGLISKDYIRLSVRIPLKNRFRVLWVIYKSKYALMLYNRHSEWRRRTGRDGLFGHGATVDTL